MLKSHDGKSVSLNPNVRYIENKNKQKTVNRNQPVGCKASTEVGNVEPLGMYAAGKKDKKNEPREGRPVGCETRTGSMVWDLKSSQQGADGQQRAT